MAEETLNTAEQAMQLLSVKEGFTTKGRTVVTRRKIALAGTLSDGSRMIIIRLCPRSRWIEAVLGSGERLLEIDHRDFWERPAELVSTLLATLDALEANQCRN